MAIYTYAGNYNPQDGTTEIHVASGDIPLGSSGEISDSEFVVLAGTYDLIPGSHVEPTNPGIYQRPDIGTEDPTITPGVWSFNGRTGAVTTEAADFPLSTYDLRNFGDVHYDGTDNADTWDIALTELSAAGGGVIEIPATQGGVIFSSAPLVVPNSGGVSLANQPTIIIRGAGGWSSGGYLIGADQNPLGGTILKFGASGVPAHIQSYGYGRLILEDFTLLITAGAAELVPFLLVTNTTIFGSRLSFWGDISKTGATCITDAVIWGGGDDPAGGNLDSSRFQGYHSFLRDCSFDRVRYLGILKGTANDILYDHPYISSSCGRARGDDGLDGQFIVETALQTTSLKVRGGPAEVKNYKYIVETGPASNCDIRVETFDVGTYTTAIMHVPIGGGSHNTVAAIGTVGTSLVPLIDESGTNNMGAWAAPTTYILGASVTISGSRYFSKAGGNVGNDPTTDGGVHWALDQGVYDSTKTYNANDCVAGFDSVRYFSIAGGNTGNDPTTDGGVHWTPIISVVGANHIEFNGAGNGSEEITRYGSHAGYKDGFWSNPFNAASSAFKGILIGTRPLLSSFGSKTAVNPGVQLLANGQLSIGDLTNPADVIVKRYAAGAWGLSLGVLRAAVTAATFPGAGGTVIISSSQSEHQTLNVVDGFPFSITTPTNPPAAGASTQMLEVEVANGLTNKIAGTVTISIASPGVISWTAHGLVAGDAVVFTTTGALPTGLVAGTVYYVLATGLTANSFEVSATPTGAAINTSGTQSGTHTATPQNTIGAITWTAAWIFGTIGAWVNPALGKRRLLIARWSPLASKWVVTFMSGADY